MTSSGSLTYKHIKISHILQDSNVVQLKAYSIPTIKHVNPPLW